MTLRLAFVAEGDAETKDCWSGCAQGFIRALRRQGASVQVINAELRGWRRLLVALATWHPDRRRWRQRFTLGGRPAVVKGQLVRASLRRLEGPLDAIIQAGGTFEIPEAARACAHHVVYADSNIRFAARGRPFSGASALDGATLDEIAAREKAVYDEADRIWTWSDALGASFVRDFGQHPSKIATIYAGADAAAGNRARRADLADRPPVVLFVGRDHRRKGSEMLLEAFAGARREVPDAELHMVGGIPDGAERPGVIVHGPIDTSTAAGRDKLAMLYDCATVFCLPSRYEPFGVVFVEAMLASLPCIGSDRWAMPEIIEDGVTGWIVRDGDVGQLTSVLVTALRDRESSALMGRRGRERALSRFTWDHVARRALEDLARLPSMRGAAAQMVSA